MVLKKSGRGSVGRAFHFQERYNNDEEFRKKMRKGNRIDGLKYYKKNKEKILEVHRKRDRELTEIANKRCKKCNKLVNYRTKGKSIENKLN